MITLVLGQASAQNPPPGAPAPGQPGMPGHGPIDDQQVLQLNPNQKGKFDAFRTKSRAAKKKLLDQLNDVRHQLWNVYQSYDLDFKQAQRLNAELNKIQQDLLKLHFDEQIELRKILTKSQFDRLQAAIRQQHGGPHGPWSGDNHGGPHGPWPGDSHGNPGWQH